MADQRDISLTVVSDRTHPDRKTVDAKRAGPAKPQDRPADRGQRRNRNGERWWG